MMIKKLRQKLIIVAMSSVIVVLVAIMGIINVVSYQNISHGADELLSVLAANGGAFPKPDKPHDKDKKPPRMSPEAPYETRYFTALLDSEGAIIATNTGFIAAITTEEAADYAKKAFSGGKNSGFDGNYKYSAVPYNGETLIVFLDCSRDLATFRSFLATSALVSFVGIAAVFLLVLIFSKAAVKPIAQSYEKQKRFITDAGHEIKTPLTIIGANTEVLELEGGENEWTRSIKGQVGRLTALTADLIALSRMDEENSPLQMTDFSLSDAVMETMEGFAALAKSRGKALTLQVESGISYHGNESAIRQLVSILGDNALKYASDAITISLQRQHKNSRLCFYNAVEEIKCGNLDVLFERFYRRDSSRNSETGGHGIGLSVAKAIATAHKGRITAESPDGRSLSIVVIL